MKALAKMLKISCTFYCFFGFITELYKKYKSFNLKIGKIIFVDILNTKIFGKLVKIFLDNSIYINIKKT